MLYCTRYLYRRHFSLWYLWGFDSEALYLEAYATDVNEFLLFENATENVGSQMATVPQLELIKGGVCLCYYFILISTRKI